MHHRPTFATIDLNALADNYVSAARHLGADIAIMCVVKADAYGHGAIRCAERLSEAGAAWMAVAIPEEGIELRKAGIKSRILCMDGFWGGQEDILFEYDLTPVVFREEQLRLLQYEAKLRRKPIKIHIKIDSGMGRVGIRYDNIGTFASLLKASDQLIPEAAMTHFAAADDPDSNWFTALQVERFELSVKEIRDAGISFEFTDLCNSPAAFGFPEARKNMVRLGGVIYGLKDDVLPPSISAPILKPVMSLSTSISHIKKLAAGATVGYGLTHTLTRPSVVATLPAGYADGIPRSLSNSGCVIVRGRRAPIIGRVSMDWTIVNVTDIPEAEFGDTAFFIGGSLDQDHISAEELACVAGTISYEVTCGISPRVPRIFVS